CDAVSQLAGNNDKRLFARCHALPLRQISLQSRPSFCRAGERRRTKRTTWPHPPVQVSLTALADTERREADHHFLSTRWPGSDKARRFAGVIAPRSGVPGEPQVVRRGRSMMFRIRAAIAALFMLTLPVA